MVAIVAIVIGAFVLVAWLAHYFSETASMERSIRSYKRRLGTIAGVVEQSAHARTSQSRPLPDEIDDQLIAPSTSDLPAAADRRIPSELGDRVYVNEAGRMVFGDATLRPVTPPKVPVHEERSMRQHRRVRTNEPHRPRRSRAIAFSGVVVVAAAGISAGVLATRHPLKAALSTTTTLPTTTTAPKVTHHSTSPKHVAAANASRPVSSNGTGVVFDAPSGRYTVSVSVDGVCWLGFQHVTKGPWLAMATLGGAQPTSYRISTSGPLAITVGAPSTMTKVSVNGSALGLPTARAKGHIYTITLRSA